jgi:excisionase family DNA binding protein
MVTPNERLLTVPESALLVRVSTRTMWRKVFAREVRSVLIGHARRIPTSALDELVERSTIPSRHDEIPDNHEVKRSPTMPRQINSSASVKQDPVCLECKKKGGKN